MVFPISQHIDLMWQTVKWLQTSEEGLDDEEISWWPLISPLTDGSDMAAKDMEIGGESVQNPRLRTFTNCPQHRAVPG